MKELIEQFIEKWSDGTDYTKNEMRNELQSLTSVKSKSAEEYFTQVVIPIELRHKNYCDLNGKVIPTEFILDKPHFFYGGYGYIVLHDFANAENKQEWISVNDRLPNEEIEKVLLYRRMNESQKSISMTIHDAKLVKYCDEYSFWMPLPEPPTNI